MWAQSVVQAGKNYVEASSALRADRGIAKTRDPTLRDLADLGFITHMYHTIPELLGERIRYRSTVHEPALNLLACCAVLSQSV